jgi:hypothetical protein
MDVLERAGLLGKFGRAEIFEDLEEVATAPWSQWWKKRGDG